MIKFDKSKIKYLLIAVGLLCFLLLACEETTTSGGSPPPTDGEIDDAPNYRYKITLDGTVYVCESYCMLSNDFSGKLFVKMRNCRGYKPSREIIVEDVKNMSVIEIKKGR